MQLSVQLIMAGIIIFWIGVIVLLSGKRADQSFNEIFGMGRKVYDNLGEVFSKPNVLAFRLLAFLGMIIVFAGIGAVFYELAG